MKFLLALAFRNLTRYTKRTVITASAIAFGLGLFIVLDSFLKGAEMESEINLINYETASAKVMHPAYLGERDNLPLKYVIEEPEKIIDILGGNSIAATPRVVFKAELFVREDPYPESGSVYVKSIALDPSRDDEVFRLRETVKKGRYLEEDENGVLIGEWMAADLGARVGYPLTLRVRTRYGAYETMDMEIVGLINSPNPQMNKNTVFLPLSTADYFLDMDGAVTELALSPGLTFDRSHDPDKMAGQIEKLLNTNGYDLQVHSWKELAPDYVAMAAMKSTGSRIILFLVFVIAAVGITNTMLMAVFERIRELGMMRAMGMSDRQIRLSFLLEAGGIGLIGAVGGLIFGALVNWPLVEWGWDFTPMLKQMDIGYRISGVFRSMWNIPTMLRAFIAGIVIAMLVALFPIRRALKMQITDCLRNE
ncbi:FtsX-like permease family protein [Marispirochaeta aestuarii]|uniref:ABC transporter permease n=1 Tax=Marispirochaeta aestuarii TaxID=1963862 RepID=UPI0029C80DC6|nr:FtsX-like permease family protein [Marispirochaeta aestuarii]